VNLLKSKNFGRCRTHVCDRATGKILRSSGWKHNLVFDGGLNILAGGANGGFADFFARCVIGSGNQSNSIASGAITFTQVGLTITASGGFFTSLMNGQLIKYGTGSGGVEQYITYVNSTTATSLTSMTQATPIVGTVWLVGQTGMETYITNSTTYSTSAGANTTQFFNNILVLQRTFVFAPPGSTQNINEIGYSSPFQTGGSCNGRIVLSSTDTVTSSEFYVVVWQLSWTISPGSPTAVANVGTGINTAGNAMFNFWDCQTVDPATGDSIYYQGSASGVMDSMINAGLSVYFGSTPSLNSIPSTLQAGISATDIAFLGTIPETSNSGQAVGVGLSTVTFVVTTGGQVVTALIIGHSLGASNNTTNIFVQTLTTPFVLPTGSFGGTVTFTNTFTRTLVN
jgi:hypothetical protein